VHVLSRSEGSPRPTPLGAAIDGSVNLSELHIDEPPVHTGAPVSRGTCTRLSGRNDLAPVAAGGANWTPHIATSRAAAAAVIARVACRAVPGGNNPCPELACADLAESWCLPAALPGRLATGTTGPGTAGLLVLEWPKDLWLVVGCTSSPDSTPATSTSNRSAPANATGGAPAGSAPTLLEPRGTRSTGARGAARPPPRRPPRSR
jgi:hypothetical protein